MLRAFAARFAFCLAFVAVLLAFAPAASAAPCHDMAASPSAAPARADAATDPARQLTACHGQAPDGTHHAAAGHVCCQLAAPPASAAALAPLRASRPVVWVAADSIFRTRAIPPPFEPPRA